MQESHFYLRSELADQWQHQDVFDQVERLQGNLFRDKEGRTTLQFHTATNSYFIKIHRGIGWQEIIKNLLQFRLPIISAKNEWQAIEALTRLGISTMTLAGYGQRGYNPARIKSFVITDELTDTVSLEHLGTQWRQRPPTFRTKKTLIEKLAEVTRTMHHNGINHRDYYLCHFLLDKQFSNDNTIDDSTELFLIDLHRAQIRKTTPSRWIIKDIGSLYYSAMDVPLTQRDLYRFIKTYTQQPLKKALSRQPLFWSKVQQRAQRLRAE